MSIIVVIAENSPFTARLRRLTDQDVVGLRPTFTEHVLNSMLSRLAAIDLVVISEEVDEQQVFDLADVALYHAPDVPIVLVRDHADRVTDEAKAAGIREVIDSATSDLDVERLLARFLRKDDPAALPAEPSAPAAPTPGRPLSPEEHRVIVVLSPKGGVGKTTTAVNFAVAMARKAPLETVIVDYDGQFGDVASMLNVSAKHTVDEAFTHDAVHSNLVLKGLLVNFEESLLVMAGSDSPAAMEKVSSPQAAQLIRQLSEEYPYVVVDTGSGLTDEALAALEVATDVVFVTTMDVSAVKALRRSVDLLDRIDLLPRNRYLLVNMADTGTGLTAEDIGQAMRMEVDATIPRSTEVMLSVNVGRPIALGRGSSPFMDAIGLLISKVSGGQRRRKGGGLFRRSSS